MENRGNSPIYGVVPHYGAQTVKPAEAVMQGSGRLVNRLNREAAVMRGRKADNAFAEAYVRICQADDLAIFAVTDAVEKVKEAGLFQKGVKHHIKRALAVIDLYEHALVATMHRRDTEQYYMDMSDAFYEGIKPVMLRFRIAIKNFLDRRGEPQSEVKSYLLWARQMLWLAVNQWNTYWEQKTEELGFDLSGHFRLARLSGALTAWDKAGDCVHWEKAGDMFADPAVNLGMRSVIIQLNNGERINGAGLKALEMNPDSKVRIVELEEINEAEKGKEKTTW